MEKPGSGHDPEEAGTTQVLVNKMRRSNKSHRRVRVIAAIAVATALLAVFAFLVWGSRPSG